MRTLVTGILLCLSVTFVCAQDELAFEKGILYLKSGDSLHCIVELAVTYNKDVSYKEREGGPTLQMKSALVKAIKTPYKYFENITLDGKERLMSQVVAGELRLFNHVTINKGDDQKGYGGTYSMNRAPTIIYALQNDSATMEVTKRNFQALTSSLMKAEPTLVARIKSNQFALENLEQAVSEYNDLRLIKKLTRKITGRVVDTETKKGVKDVTVTIYGLSTKMMTNALGYFQLDVLPWDTLQIIHREYKPIEVTIPAANAFLIPFSKFSTAELDSIAAEIDKLTWKDFETQFKKHVRFPRSGLMLRQEGMTAVAFSLDSDGNIATMTTTTPLGEYGEQVQAALTSMPVDLMRMLQRKHGKNSFILPVIFNLDTTKDRKYSIDAGDAIPLQPINVVAVGIKRKL